MLIWDWFLRPEADLRSQRIGSIGRWLRRARRRADYDPATMPDLSSEARTAVAFGRQILAELDTLG